MNKNKVFLDYNKIFNQDNKLYLGNKLLHAFFAIKLASKWNIKLIFPKNSCFENLFKIKKKYILKNYKKPNLNYSESSAFEIYRSSNIISFYFNFLKSYIFTEKYKLKKIFQDSKKQYLENSKILKNKFSEKDFYIKGNFWHYNLMPSSYEIKKYLIIKDKFKKKIKRLFPDLTKKNTIVVHLRGGDYKNHLNNYFNKTILIDKEYYQKSINFFKKKIGKKAKFYFLTNDINLLNKYLDGIQIEKKIIKGYDAYFDWVCLMLAKNIIQSNSSFCWTASLFNKINSTQPKNGYAYNYKIGPIPFGFYMKNSKII
tara:strand:+ start:6473 stop:7411 length:939 start_codon:yes stop_codon:yes gene_type:complete